MTDTITPEQRSKTMQAVKSSKTKLEDKVTKALWKKGLRYRRNKNNLYGKPDISIQKYKVVIFIDSCFWHGCPEHGRIPKSNVEYWLSKIIRNKQRDIEVNEYYASRDWVVIRLWEHQLQKNNFDTAIDDVVRTIEGLHQKVPN